MLDFHLWMRWNDVVLDMAHCRQSPVFGHSQKTHWEVLIYFCGKSGAKEAENTAAYICIEPWELHTRCRHRDEQVL